MTAPARSALSWALAALARRSHGGAELAEKLTRKGFPPGEVREALESLVREGLVDDRRFAREWVLSRSRDGRAGPVRLRRDLLAKGVPEEAVSGALAEILPPHSEAEAEGAKEALRRKARTLRKEGIHRRAALFRFLQGRGFTPLAILAALKDEDQRGAEKA